LQRFAKAVSIDWFTVKAQTQSRVHRLVYSQGPNADGRTLSGGNILRATRGRDLPHAETARKRVGIIARSASRW